MSKKLLQTALTLAAANLVAYKEMYEEACRYAADLNMEVVEKYMEA